MCSTGIDGLLPRVIIITSMLYKTRVLPPPAIFDGLLPRVIIIQSIDEFSMTGDRAYEIPYLKVYPPISPIGLGASPPRTYTLKH